MPLTQTQNDKFVEPDKLNFLFQHLYPKSQIDVFVTVLENDGSFVAGAITCAGLALADAAIDMFDVIVGASMVR